MDAESSGGFGDVVITVCENTVDVFPFGLGEGWNGYFFVCFWHFYFGAAAFEGGEDIVHVGGFGQEVNRTEFDCIDCR